MSGLPASCAPRRAPTCAAVGGCLAPVLAVAAASACEGDEATLAPWPRVGEEAEAEIGRRWSGGTATPMSVARGEVPTTPPKSVIGGGGSGTGTAPKLTGSITSRICGGGGAAAAFSGLDVPPLTADSSGFSPPPPPLAFLSPEGEGGSGGSLMVGLRRFTASSQATCFCAVIGNKST